jgi:hypothetical protein
MHALVRDTKPHKRSSRFKRYSNLFFKLPNDILDSIAGFSRVFSKSHSRAGLPRGGQN